MEHEEYQRLMAKAREGRNKRLGVNLLGSLLDEMGSIWNKKGSIPGNYDRAVARAKAPEEELKQQYLSSLQSKKEGTILENLSADKKNTEARTAKTISEHDQYKKTANIKNDPNHPLAVQARRKAKQQGYKVPDNADLQYFELASKMGLKTFLPKDYQTVTTYDSNNVPSINAWDKNNPSAKPVRLGGGKQDLITDELGIKGYASGKRLKSFGENGHGYAEEIEKVDSPIRRKEIRNWIDKDFRQNKRWHEVSEQVDAVGKVQMTALSALKNPIAASSIRVFLGALAGLKGAQSDRDIAMFEGSNDFLNWLDRRYESIAKSRKITDQDYKDIMIFTNKMAKSMHKNLNILKVKAIKRLEPQAPELSQSGRRSLINQNYNTEFIDSFVKKLDKPKDDSEIPGYKETDEVADKSVPEGHTFQDEDGKTYMVGKGGRIYEKV